MALNIDDVFLDTHFNLLTQEINQLTNQMFEWIADGIPGAIIYGRARIGKTRAMLAVSSKIHEKYGRELPIYMYTATPHTPTDRYFYSELLKMVGNINFEKGTITALKERLIAELISVSVSTASRRIIFFIDEASHFTDKDYLWLMDVYNHLNIRNIHLSVFLFGTEDLKSKKEALIIARQHQIVGRFMVEEVMFHGIRSIKDMTICLLNLDTPQKLPDGKKIIFTKEFFPNAFQDGRRFACEAENILKIYEQNMKRYNIPTTSEIPMMYFMSMLRYCLKNFGKYGESMYFPNEECWEKAILHSGYLAAERIYFNV